MASKDVESVLEETSSFEDSRSQVRLVEYAVPAPRDKVTRQEIEKHKATLNQWYGMAEKGMLYKDDSMIESAIANIKLGMDKIKELYTAIIENSGPDKPKHESEFESCIKNHTEFVARIDDFRSQGSDMTITCQENVSDVKISRAPSVKSVATVCSKGSSRISSASVHIARAKVKEERAKIQLRRLQEQEEIDAERTRMEQRIAAETQKIAAETQKIAAETQRIAAEKQRIAAENQRIAADNEQRKERLKIQSELEEARMEAKVWRIIEDDARSKHIDKDVSLEELDHEAELHPKTGVKTPEKHNEVTAHQHQVLNQNMNCVTNHLTASSRPFEDGRLLHQSMSEQAPLRPESMAPQVNFQLPNSYLPQAQVNYVLNDLNAHSRALEERGPLHQDVNPLVPVSSQENLQVSSPQVAQTEDTLAKGIVAAIGQAMHLPKLDHITFSGNPVDYYFFCNNFESNLDVKAPTAGLKMDFLLHQCKGQARAKIHHCSIYDPEEGFAEAKKILHKNYGDPDIVTLAFTDQLLNFKPLKYEDNSGLEEFALLLKKCVLVLGRIGTLGELNTIERISDLAAKLPKDVWGGWRKESGVIKGKTGKRPTILNFAAFVEQESDNKNSYLAKALASKRDDEKPQNKKSTSQRKSTNSYVVATEMEGETKAKSSNACKCCLEDHPLFKCRKFKQKSVNERLKFLKEKGVCFNCLFGGHMVKDCVSQRTCSVNGCGRKHNTLLHMNRDSEDTSFKKRQSEQEKKLDLQNKSISVAHATMTKSERLYRSVVPVIVRANGKEIQTHALIDIGSDSSFCDNKLVEKLGLTGTQRQIEICTLGQQPIKHDCTFVNMTIAPLDDSEEISLEGVMTINQIPVSPNSPLSEEELEEFSYLRGIEFPQIESNEVSLLIGTDVPYVHKVLDVRSGHKRALLAQKLPVGWILIGGSKKLNKSNVNFLQTDIVLDQEIRKFWDVDFIPEPGDLAFPTSKEDREVLKLLDSSVTYEAGQYVVPLPWKSGMVLPPGSRALAERRLEYLRKRLSHDEDLRLKYTEKMNEYINEGHAIKVEASDKATTGPEWYLCHHPVSTPNKPKVRIVFDCAAKYKGISLNQALLPGPNLVNPLVSVLTSFRKEIWPLVGDVKAMYYQVRIRDEDCDALRFLYWPEGNINKKPEVWKMVKAAFGLTCSPCIATYCLRQVVKRFGHEFDSRISDIIYHDMYVDDCLTSVSCEEVAVSTRRQLTELLHKGNFHLSKWISTSHAVMNDIPECDRADSVKDVAFQESAMERVLGIHWSVEHDAFFFQISDVKLKGFTKRHLLSALNSLFDPLGMLAPVTLIAKLMFQEIVQEGFGWDEIIPDERKDGWLNWFSQIKELSELSIPRCFKPMKFGQVEEAQIHHFCDASGQGYGMVSYLRLVDEEGKVHCSFLCGKSRVTPARSESIPRLELIAAVLAVKVDKWLRNQLKYPNCQSMFWTDSSAVRQSINNPSKRFRTFVSNRLAKIHRQTVPAQWKHVPSKENPADDASRGLNVQKFPKSSRWLTGPEFLWNSSECWHEKPEKEVSIPEEFEPIEIKISAVTTVEVSTLDKLIDRYSDLHKLTKAVAWILRFVQYLKDRKSTPKGSITVTETSNAENEIVKYVQRRHFGTLVKALQGPEEYRDVKRVMKKKNDMKALSKLNPLLVDGLLRIGGRLDRAPIPFDMKHPKILPQESNFTRLLIWFHHKKVGHFSIAHIWNSIREEYWIVKARSAIRQELRNCVLCRKVNSSRAQQLMAELPSSRLQADKPPFYNTGIDYFGPFLVRRGRSEIKKYGCIFTCLITRCVHIELADDLSTDAFINAFRRFIARRSTPHCCFSDNGTILVGAYRILKEAIQDMDQSKIQKFCLQQRMLWRFNPPAASNIGGVWEILIRSVRRILNKIFYKSPVVSQDVLHTSLVECENILNSRPLTPISFEPGEFTPLTPNHLLKQEAVQCLPPGLFGPKDSHSKRKWRQVQFIADEFWRRWYKEYLPTIAIRQKWNDKKRNLEINDLVIVVNENLPRGRWDLGRVVSVYPDRHNIVRQVDIKTQNGILKRPINKLCLIKESE